MLDFVFIFGCAMLSFAGVWLILDRHPPKGPHP